MPKGSQAPTAGGGDAYTDDQPAHQLTAPEPGEPSLRTTPAIRPHLAPVDRIYDQPDPQVIAQRPGGAAL